MLRRALLIVPVAIALLVPASAAQASDLSLRRMVVRHELRVTPLATKFAKAVKSFSKEGRPGKLNTATARYRAGIKKFRKAIRPLHASTKRFRKAKLRMRDSLVQFDKGLGLIQRALRRFKKGATPKQVNGDIKAGDRSLARATRNQRIALRGFKIRVG